MRRRRVFEVLLFCFLSEVPEDGDEPAERE
jgi:hypothetical protein